MRFIKAVIMVLLLSGLTLLWVAILPSPDNQESFLLALRMMGLFALTVLIVALFVVALVKLPLKITLNKGGKKGS